MTDAAKAGRPIGNAGLRPVGESGPAGSRAEKREHGSSRLSDQAQARIGHNLRCLYDGLVQQPVPDRFRELIERLDSKEPKSP